VLTELVSFEPDAVDEELVRGFADPAKDPNAFHVFREIYTTEDAGPYPLDILDDIECPILLLWGTADTLTPSNGPVGRALRDMATERQTATLSTLMGLGTCFSMRDQKTRSGKSQVGCGNSPDIHVQTMRDRIISASLPGSAVRARGYRHLTP
jgi:hypothetical protein